VCNVRYKEADIKAWADKCTHKPAGEGKKSLSELSKVAQAMYYSLNLAAGTQTRLASALKIAMEKGPDALKGKYDIKDPPGAYGGLKSVESTTLKLCGRLNGHVRGLSDLARITVVFDDDAALQAAVSQLKKLSDEDDFKSENAKAGSKGFKTAMVKNRFTRPEPGKAPTEAQKENGEEGPNHAGYMDVNYRFIDTTTGMRAEVQFHLCHILAYKQKAGHAEYEIQRVIENKIAKATRRDKDTGAVSYVGYAEKAMQEDADKLFASYANTWKGYSEAFKKTGACPDPKDQTWVPAPAAKVLVSQSGYEYGGNGGNNDLWNRISPMFKEDIRVFLESKGTKRSADTKPKGT
jgi:hypothetical protein